MKTVLSVAAGILIGVAVVRFIPPIFCLVFPEFCDSEGMGTGSGGSSDEPDPAEEIGRCLKNCSSGPAGQGLESLQSCLAACPGQ